MAGHRESERIEVSRGTEVVAVVDIVAAADRVSATVLGARSFGLVRADAEAAIDAIVVTARARPAGRVDLVARDPLVRATARAAGFGGVLRADLNGAVESLDASAAAVARAITPADVVVALEQLLPDTRVEIDPGGWAARVSRRLVTGTAGAARISAARNGTRVATVAVVGADLMVESLAAALDTQLRLAARFEPIAHRIPTVAFAMADGQMVGGRVSGQAGSGAISINPAHVNIAALESLARQGSAPRASFEAGTLARRRPGARCLPVDEVVAHEIGHVIDHSIPGGRVSDRTEFRQRIGRALGVDSAELALRGSVPDAPPEWQRAHRDLSDQISDYATTSGVELFAEIFEAWFHGRRGTVVAAFDALMELWLPSPR